MELFENLTDDQIALMGCFCALLVSGGLMALTGWVRSAPQHPPRETSAAAAVRLPMTSARRSASEQRDRSPRKAA